jgi:enoyl-CoA hydratase
MPGIREEFGMDQPETIFTVENGLGRIVLNRPQALNALSAAQFHDLDDRLAAWAAEPLVSAVVISGAGDRAFCAGGDIRAIVHVLRDGQHDVIRRLAARHFGLDRRIHHFPKPYVALLNGVVMGGGAGISINGGFRVACERTLFAMPENSIGYFPDAGATHFLSRCPGLVGLYLGLTGARLGPADCWWTGLATHYVPLADHDSLLVALGRAAGSGEARGAIEAVLAEYHRDPGPPPLAQHRDAIDRCFARSNVRAIISALIAEGSDWAWETVEPMGDNAPMAMAATLRQLTEGRTLSFDDAVRLEYRMAYRFLERGDFPEGIRAKLIDRDNKPQWMPSTLADINPTELEECFAPLGANELAFG